MRILGRCDVKYERLQVATRTSAFKVETVLTLQVLYFFLKWMSGNFSIDCQVKGYSEVYPSNCNQICSKGALAHFLLQTSCFGQQPAEWQERKVAGYSWTKVRFKDGNFRCKKAVPTNISLSSAPLLHVLETQTSHICIGTSGGFSLHLFTLTYAKVPTLFIINIKRNALDSLSSPGLPGTSPITSPPDATKFPE